MPQQQAPPKDTEPIEFQLSNGEWADLDVPSGSSPEAIRAAINKVKARLGTGGPQSPVAPVPSPPGLRSDSGISEINRERVLGLARQTLPGGEHFKLGFDLKPSSILEVGKMMGEGLFEAAKTGGQLMTLGSIDPTTGQPIPGIRSNLIPETPEEEGFTGDAAQGQNQGRVAGDLLNLAMMFGAPKVPLKGSPVGAATKAAQTGLSSRVINSLIKPAAKEFRFGRNPGKNVVDHVPVANTKAGLLENITKTKKSFGQQIDQVLSAASKETVDVSVMLEPIDAAIQKAVKSNNQPYVTKLMEMRKGLTEDLTLGPKGTIESTGNAKPMKVSPIEATNIKRQIGEATKWSNEAFEAEMNQVRVEAYGKLREAIEKKVPKVAPLNETYGGLLSAEKSLDKVIRGGQGKDLTGLGDLILASGGGAVGGFGAGLALPLARRVAGSTAVKTRAAKLLNLGNK